MAYQPEKHQLVFIGGLHRSGTTPVANWVAAHPQVSAFREAGVPENEGQHLQDVYEPAARYGGPGKFAFRAGAHLTEDSVLVSGDARARLWASWCPYWDLNKPVLVEKSPPNLVRTRFLQAIFPQSLFLIVVRHPIAVAYATKKWSRTRVGSLMRHWMVAHELLLADIPLVERIRIVRYEDLVAHPGEVLQQVFDFVGLEDPPVPGHVEQRLNGGYLARWPAEDAGPLGRLRVARLERGLGAGVARFGYSLRPPFHLRAPATAIVRHFLGVHAR